MASDAAPAAPDQWRPAVGDLVCTCGYEHLRIIELEPDDPDGVVVEGGGSYSVTRCLDPVPHSDWEHYPSLPAVLSSPYSAATWPEPIALLYREAHDAATSGLYSDTKSFCRQVLRRSLESEGSTGSRLVDLIAGCVGQGKLPVGIQEWATEIDLVRSEGMRYEDLFHIREYDASDALLFTRSCLETLHGTSAGT